MPTSSGERAQFPQSLIVQAAETPANEIGSLALLVSAPAILGILTVVGVVFAMSMPMRQWVKRLQMFRSPAGFRATLVMNLMPVRDRANELTVSNQMNLEHFSLPNDRGVESSVLAGGFSRPVVDPAFSFVPPVFGGGPMPETFLQGVDLDHAIPQSLLGLGVSKSTNSSLMDIAVSVSSMFPLASLNKATTITWSRFVARATTPFSIVGLVVPQAHVLAVDGLVTLGAGSHERMVT